MVNSFVVQFIRGVVHVQKFQSERRYYSAASPEQHRNGRATVQVVLSKYSNVPRKSLKVLRDAEPYPIAWLQNYGEGHVFYNAMGHREDVWQTQLVRNFHIWT